MREPEVRVVGHHVEAYGLDRKTYKRCGEILQRPVDPWRPSPGYKDWLEKAAFPLGLGESERPLVDYLLKQGCVVRYTKIVEYVP